MLINLKRKVESKYSSVNFLIDEVNQEILTKSYASKLAKGLKSEFKDSTVVLALQSVNKEKEIKSSEDSDGKNMIQLEKMDISPLEDFGVKVLCLEKSVRMSFEIYELQKAWEEKATANPFKTILEYKETDDTSE